MQKLTFITFSLLIGILLGAAPTAAQRDRVLIDEVRGAYRIVATITPEQLEVGEAVMTITVTDAATGAPADIPAINIIARSVEIGRDRLYLAPPVLPRNGVYRSDRLYFSTAGTWQLRLQVLTESQQYELNTTFEVGSVFGRIGRAGRVMVPASLGVLVVLYIGWRVWGRRWLAARREIIDAA